MQKEEEPEQSSERQALQVQIRSHFRPEFLARIDRVVHFRALAPDDYGVLFDRMFADLSDHMKSQRGLTLEATDEVRKQLSLLAMEQGEGVRGFRALFERLLLAPLQTYAQDLTGESTLHVSWKEGAPVFTA
jgi:ATP-dependent Clp protease ATP-binding subunit ClpB